MLLHVDILIVHVPLNAKTRGMVCATQFKMMRQGSILINIARRIVDEDDLMEAVEEGRIFGTGLECYEEEPPTLQKYQKLWATGKVIDTPFIAATTAEMQLLTSTTAFDNLNKISKLG